MKSLLTVMLCVAALAPRVGQADLLSYTYWEGGYIRADIDGLSEDPDGFILGLSVELTDQVFVFGRYGQVETTIYGFDIDETDYSLGIGYAWSLKDNLDIVGRVAYLGAEAELEDVGSVDDDGYGISIGVRARPADRVELEGGVQYSDFSDLGDDTSVGAAAYWYLTEGVAIGVFGSIGDDVTNYGITLRGVWGRAGWSK